MVKSFDPAVWYRPCESDDQVFQGALFFDVILRQVVPDPNRSGQYAIGTHSADIIVATQSCDLQQNKVAVVEVIPVYPLVEWLFYEPSFFGQLETIRRGHAPGLYLLPAWPQAPFPQARETRIVAFDEKRGITWEDLSVLRHGRWLGLQSPYIEHFGQALARFYMRVGLPEDMPEIRWKPVTSERGSSTEPIGPDDQRLAKAGLTPRVKPLVVSIQKLQLTTGPDELFRAALKQNGSFFGIGRTSDEATSSLLQYLATRRGPPWMT